MRVGDRRTGLDWTADQAIDLAQDINNRYKENREGLPVQYGDALFLDEVKEAAGNGVVSLAIVYNMLYLKGVEDGIKQEKERNNG